MKCSVVVPYANTGEQTHKLLRSLEKQTYDKNKFEVIVINNGEADDLDKYIEKEHFTICIKYFHCTQRGRAVARNYGIQKASGELIIFVDGDEIVPNDFVKNYWDRYKEANHPILQFGLKKQLFPDGQEQYNDKKELLQNGKRYALQHASQYGVKEIEGSYYIKDVRHQMLEHYQYNFERVRCKMLFTQTSNLSIPKVCIEKYGGFDENFIGWGVEDWEFGYRMQKNNIAIVYNPLVEVLHQYHNASYGQKRFDEWKRNLEYMIGKYQDDFVGKLTVFESFFNSEIRNQIKDKDPTANVWMTCFYQVEKE